MSLMERTRTGPRRRMSMIDFLTMLDNSGYSITRADSYIASKVFDMHGEEY